MSKAFIRVHAASKTKVASTFTAVVWRGSTVHRQCLTMCNGKFLNVDQGLQRRRSGSRIVGCWLLKILM